MTFRRELRRRQPDPADRRWLFVPYDQLTDQVGPLAGEDPSELGIVLIESLWKPGRRPYHKQKLAFILANQRHFALEQAKRGVAVRYVVGRSDYRRLLEPIVQEVGPMRLREPAERELRHLLQPLVQSGSLVSLPHDGWLTTDDQFEASQPNAQKFHMDSFYRFIRQESGVLMDGDEPLGGQYSFDADNRERWPGSPPPPDPPVFAIDDIKREVLDLVEEQFADHPGRLSPDRLPATRSEAETAWNWALSECLSHFGPYEDAMTVESSGLFHTRISPLLNIERLSARRVLDDVLATDVPLSSKEGFVRQLLGWREFVRHVHRRTDGFRKLPGQPDSSADGVAEADPSHLGASRPLPQAFWGDQSGLHCLDRVVEDVVDEAWSHHITRLMVLANIASLLDVRPREITDWFWVMYVDAFDWVVEPNVLAMGTFGVGDLMTTKPYVSGANYINRMSDYCEDCVFDPRGDCPLRRLYWAYLARHAEILSANGRMSLPLASLKRRNEEEKQRDAATFQWVGETLGRGDRLTPEASPSS